MHLHRDALAEGNAFPQEHVRGLVDLLVELAVRESFDAAIAALEDEEVLFAAFACELVPQACERLAANDVDHVPLPLP